MAAATGNGPIRCPPADRAVLGARSTATVHVHISHNLPTYLLPIVDLLGAVITTAGLVDALVLVGSSTKIAALLCLESLYIVILPIYLHMSGASFVAALFGNVSHDAITEHANFRTDIFASFEGADADNCVADQVAVTNGPAEEQTNEEE